MEIEAKFDILEPGTVTLDQVLAALESYGVRSVSVLESVEVLDTYFDTEDLVLYQGGAGLRLRKKAGKAVLTLKVRGERMGAVFSRQEIEGPVSKELIEDVQHTLLQHGFIKTGFRFEPSQLENLQLLSDWGFMEAVVIHSKRRKCLLADTETFAELSYDDVVFVHAGQRQARPSLEVEALDDRFLPEIESLAKFLHTTFGDGLEAQTSSKYELAVSAFNLGSTL